MDSGSLALGADHRSRGWTFVIAGPASRVCTTPGPARSQSPEERQTAACLVRGFAGLARCFQRRLFVGARVRQVFPATGRAFLARLAEIVWYPALRTQPRRSMMVGVKPRRVVILAFAGVQPLDVVGRAEVFSVACRLAPGAYTVEVVACEREPIFTGGGYGIVPAATTARLSRSDRHAHGRGWRRGEGSARGRCFGRLGAGCSRPVASCDLSVFGRVPARSGRPARRPPCNDALGSVRGATATLPRG